MAIKQQFKNLDELLAGTDKPVLVDFYAEWCGPCQMMAKVLEDVNGQMGDRLKVVKINTETYQELASKHQIAALPTLILFKQGQVVKRIEGLMPAHELVKVVETFV
jgi:thioredoxin